jgi:pimeloyl-ACP methyl ester carboxylesterase
VTTTSLLDTGPRPGPHAPVVLLHGWTGSHDDFLPVVDALAVSRRVIVPDLPGHGGAPPPADGDWSLAAHVRVVEHLLEDAGVDELHLVGHSHGGLVAQRVAQAHSHRLRSLTLIGTGMGALGDEARQMVIDVADAVLDRGMPAAWDVVTGVDDGDDDRDADAATAHLTTRDMAVRERFLSMRPEAVVGVGRNLLTAAPVNGAFLRGIDVPVLVCHGEGDRTWLPHEQQRLARSIRGARYAVIPDALHSPATENPDGLLLLLTPFLAAADDRARTVQPPIPTRSP